MLFDTRIGELADNKSATLAPTWDCRIPLNVNDSDLRSEMKEPPLVQGKFTEAFFAVVRSEWGDFIRHTKFHLDFTSPALRPFAKDVQHGPIPEGGELVNLEKMIEGKYLKFCDPEDPLQFMTIWMTRAHLAKYRLVEYYSRYSSSSVYQTDAQRDAAISHALSMLECDTKIMTSPLTKRYLWLLHFYFPFIAYIQLVQYMSGRPVSQQAEQAWEVMSDNYEARFVLPCRDDSPLFDLFAKIVLHAWETREAAFRQLEEPLMPPRIVSHIKNKIAQTAQNAQNADTEHPNNVMGMGMDDFPMSVPMSFGSNSLLYSIEGQDGYAGIGLGEYPNMLGQAPLNVDVNHLDWAAMDWGFVDAPADGPAESVGPSLPRQPQGPAANQNPWTYR